jgi:hypothetical protein
VSGVFKTTRGVLAVRGASVEPDEPSPRQCWVDRHVPAYRIAGYCWVSSEAPQLGRPEYRRERREVRGWEDLEHGT